MRTPTRAWKAMALAAVLLLAAGGVRAEDEAAAPLGKASYEFDQAIQSYLKGDSASAIQSLNESLKHDPANPRAKVFLLKLLVERGSRLFMAKQYPKAYDYLAQAYAMDPNNEQVRQMFDIAAKQVRPQQPVTKVMLIPQGMQAEMLKSEAAARAQAIGVPGAALAPAAGNAPRAGGAGVTPMYAEPAPMEAPGAQAGGGLTEEYAKNVTAMMNLLNSFQRRQEKQIDAFTVPLERIQNLYYQSEKDRKNFLDQMDTRFKSVLGDVSFQQRMVIYGFLFGLGLLCVVVWGFWLVIGRMRSRREEMIMKYQQEMLKMVRDMSGLRGGSGYGSLPPMMGGQAMLGGGYAPGGYLPYGAPAAPDLPADAEPIRQLDRMIQTGNLKERALAAMQMLDLNVDRALGVIKSMSEDPDPFQREAMAFALGEKYHPLTLDLLGAAVRDPERRVAAAALRALSRLEQKGNEIPPEALAQIRQALNAKPGDGAGGRKGEPA